MESSSETSARLLIGDLVLDPGRHRITRDGQVLDLPKLSFKLVSTLAKAAPNVVSHDQLIAEVWSGEVVSPETVTQRIKLVRQAIGDDAAAPRYIGVVRGAGYQMLANVEELPPEETNVARGLVAELGRRRVLQVALIYAAIAWSITEVVSFLIEALPVFPEWSKALVAIVFIVGFPVAMFLAWRFDIGPGGIKRTEAASTEGRVTIMAASLLLVGATAGLFYLIYPRVIDQAQIVQSENFLRGRIAVEPNTIAVLPFTNAGDSADDLYMSEGLGDELRDQLGRIDGLKVAARSSSVMFRDQTIDAQSIAERLSVRKLIEGTLRRQGNRLRITVQMIDGQTGFADWTESYNRNADDLLSIQQEIANEIVRNILPSAVQSRSVALPATLNPSAHELMLLARYYFQQVKDEPIVDVDKLLHAIDLYHQATNLDPDSALAHSRLGATLLYWGNVEAAERPIFQALAIDSELSEVQYTLGLYYWMRNLPGSGSAYERAVALNPNNADALEVYGKWIWHQPDTDGAEVFLQRALEIDPMSIYRHAELGNFYGVTGERDKALEIVQQIIEKFDDIPAYMALARIYELIGDLDQAIAWALKATNKDPDYVFASWMLAELYTRIGEFDAATQFEPDPGFSPLYYQRRYDEFIDLTEELVLDQPDQIQLWFGLARAYVATGRNEQAIYVLQSQGVPEHVFVDSRRSNAIEAAVTLADALNSSGQATRARDLATWLKRHFTTFNETGAPAAWWSDLYLACSLSILGEDEESLSTLERLFVAPGFPWQPVLLDSPCFQRFSDEPRYLAVVESIENRKAVLRQRLPETLRRLSEE
jgi:TolB-like protein/DNA-binding winged helix-turn-helix (wHTH) protein/Tfp pilus assembly protein PilF